jgi:hypothetical protein
MGHLRVRKCHHPPRPVLCYGLTLILYTKQVS